MQSGVVSLSNESITADVQPRGELRVRGRHEAWWTADPVGEPANPTGFAHRSRNDGVSKDQWHHTVFGKGS